MLQWRILTIAHVMSLLPYLHRVAAGSDLSGEEAREAMSVLLEGEAGEAEIAGFLVALKMKGETAAELAGFARAMRDRMIVVDAGPDVIDTCGTGGDGSGTFNISTAAAIVMAGAGAHVAKHGNRSISSNSGSADVLEALGVRVTDVTPEETARSIREIGIGFLFAPALHPAMKHAQAVRRALKTRTVFNLLGPLVNPARAQRAVDRGSVAGNRQTDGGGSGRIGNPKVLRRPWARRAGRNHDHGCHRRLRSHGAMAS